MKPDCVTLRRVSPAEADSLGLRHLYETSFPPEERRPWGAFAGLPPEFGFYAILGGSGPLGMLTLWQLDGFAYIEHFAVFPRLRGAGIGSMVLSAAAGIAGERPLVLEAEPEESGATARRRIGFYRRNGFTAHGGFSYVQPPYAEGLPSVPLTLLTRGRVADLAAVARELHSRVYGRDENIS